jgi:ABC-type branched-subunit amino acid transport system ATPase component
MVGRDVLLRVDKPPAQPKEPMLEVRDLEVRDDRDLPAVRGASLTVRGGEIVALAGVDGNGQSELVEAITGLRTVDAGAIRVGGEDLTHASARRMVRHGVSHIAEDRQRRGLVLQFTLAENSPCASTTPGRCRAAACSCSAACATRPRGSSRSTTSAAAARPRTRRRCRAATSRSASSRARSRATRACCRRAADARPRRGRDRVRPPPPGSERDAGRGILLVSLEFEEVRSLADRIVVIYEGEIVGEFPARRVRGGARHRDDRRWAPAGGGGVRRVRTRSPAGRRSPARRPRGRGLTPAARLAAYLQGGASSCPLLTQCSPSCSAGLVHPHHRPQPVLDLQGDLQRHGLNWLFPWISESDRTPPRSTSSRR